MERKERMEKRESFLLPEVEFEGPMGIFWSMKEVPFEAMIKGASEIIGELLKRGYKQEIILEAIRKEPQEVVA